MAEKDKGKKKAVTTKKKTNAVVRLWRETMGELRKVSWPTTQEAWRLTRIVIVVMIAMSFLLGIFDFIFSKLIGILFA
jgi:preprotein translocase subunit SecE